MQGTSAIAVLPRAAFPRAIRSGGACVAAALGLACGTLDAATTPRVDASSFVDSTVAGYQAWFACPDASKESWTHWSAGQIPAPGAVTFELYPDVREYPDEALCDTALGPLAGDPSGAPSRLYDSASPAVIDTHFRWMREYGIDGVAVQRFVVGLGGDQTRGDAILARVRAAAEREGRVFHVTYDTSGGDPDRWAATVRADWLRLTDDGGALDLDASDRYVREGGRAVVNLWGLGFADRKLRAADALELVRWFKTRGHYVVGGVPADWSGIEAWRDVYAALDMIQPWAVGTMRSLADVESRYDGEVASDIAAATANGQDYQRVIYPGFAWSNWMDDAPNWAPRLGGELMWRMAARTAEAGVGAYIAMFDEYDESTAIAKAARGPDMAPIDQYFLTLAADDGIRPSADFYLRLAGAATEMLAGRAQIVDAVPVPLDVARLAPGAALAPGMRLVSPDGAASLVNQRDGNLVVYAAGRALWASDTVGIEPGELVMQSDGNLVLHDAGGAPAWSSGTAGRPGGALELAEGGELTVRGVDGAAVWTASRR